MTSYTVELERHKPITGDIILSRPDLSVLVSVCHCLIGPVVQKNSKTYVPLKSLPQRKNVEVRLYHEQNTRSD